MVIVRGTVGRGRWRACAVALVADNSSYDQANDFSFNAASTSFVDSPRVTVYISGTLVSGTEPT